MGDQKKLLDLLVKLPKLNLGTNPMNDTCGTGFQALNRASILLAGYGKIIFLKLFSLGCKKVLSSIELGKLHLGD
jgi:hypothetical protein